MTATTHDRARINAYKRAYLHDRRHAHHRHDPTRPGGCGCETCIERATLEWGLRAVLRSLAAGPVAS